MHTHTHSDVIPETEIHPKGIIRCCHNISTHFPNTHLPKLNSTQSSLITLDPVDGSYTPSDGNQALQMAAPPPAGPAEVSPTPSREQTHIQSTLCTASFVVQLPGLDN